ncbi:uncharacterized protein LOC111382828 isoform X2 [Olea europaea var. sylvestris]|uniref:uncharacterized protein LOC111382828 isoform X2 n=1 Tax=Olea europaea var. sylvestris TaxID=158386 RepID=UPI000C1D0835|nr:uncharacterized protein LOC111382828 isoform X2 [Olea europaea var. sylvestris]
MDASKKKLVVQAREGDMHISGKFDVDLNDQQMVEIVERHCCERYKEHRSACNKKYKQLKLDEKDPLQCRPSTVKSQEDWEWMCAHFESDKLLKRSATGKLNHSKLLYSHHGGTRSFTATREALKWWSYNNHKQRLKIKHL